MAWLRRSLLGAVAVLLPTGTTTTARCPTGPWLSQGQLDVTHAACGAVGDGGTDDSGAVERCLRIAANCSVPLFFPPGMYYLPSTVVVAKERGVPSSVSLMGSRAIAAPGAYEVGAGAASILRDVDEQLLGSDPKPRLRWLLARIRPTTGFVRYVEAEGL